MAAREQIRELRPDLDVSNWKIACKGNFGDSFFPNPDLIIWTRYDEDSPDSLAVYIAQHVPEKRKGALELRIDSLFSLDPPSPQYTARSKKTPTHQSSNSISVTNSLQEKNEMRNIFFFHCVHRGDVDRYDCFFYYRILSLLLFS